MSASIPIGPSMAEPANKKRVAEFPEDREALEHIARALKGRVLRGPELVTGDEASSELEPISLGGEELKAFLEAMPAAIAILAGGHLVHANAAFAYAFGYRSYEELNEAGGLDAILPGSGTVLDSAAATGRSEAIDALTRSRRRLKVIFSLSALGAERGAHLLRLIDQTTLDADPPPPPPDEAVPQPDPGSAEPETKRMGDGPGRMDFLAKVSHEVRTPLNSILGFTELMLQERLGPIGNPRYKGYIEDIHQSGLYALSLLNDLLDISKMEAGKFELDFTAVDVPELVTECVNSLQPLAKRERIVLRTSFAPNLPAVIADPRRLKQILLNLLSNAIKFTDVGGQVITSASLVDGDLRVRVRDNGVGMTEDEIAFAMQPFHQLDTAPRRQTGTGLGLPVTKALVDANRAGLVLTSEPGVGTCADVVFPADRLTEASGSEV